MAHSSLISPCSTKLTCIVPPPPYPDGKYTAAATHGAGIAIRSSWLYCQPLMGARSHLRSFLSSVAYGGSPPTLQPRRFAGRLDFFFAAGAFTGRLDTLPLLFRKHYWSMNKFSRCICISYPSCIKPAGNSGQPFLLFLATNLHSSFRYLSGINGSGLCVQLRSGLYFAINIFSIEESAVLP